MAFIKKGNRFCLNEVLSQAEESSLNHAIMLDKSNNNQPQLTQQHSASHMSPPTPATMMTSSQTQLHTSASRVQLQSHSNHAMVIVIHFCAEKTIRYWKHNTIPFLPSRFALDGAKEGVNGRDIPFGGIFIVMILNTNNRC